MNKYSLMIDTTTDYFYCSFLDERENKQKGMMKVPNNVETCNSNLRKVMNENNITFPEITKVYLTIGPGTYTGLRIGGVIARTIANLFKCSLYVIDALRLQVKHEGKFISVISTSKKCKNIAVFQNGNKVFQKTTTDFEHDLNEIINQYPQVKVVIDYHEINLFEYFQNNLDAYQLLPSWTDLKLLY